jgi:hypothetical protein
MFFLRQSTVSQLVVVKLVDSIDGVTPETGKTLGNTSKRISKNGAAFGNISDGTVAELEDGLYTIQLNATDSATLGSVTLHIETIGCMNYDEKGYVLPANVYDSLFSTDKLQADIQEVAGMVVSSVDDFKANVGTLATQLSLDAVGVLCTAINAKTSLIPASPAAVGSQMDLVDSPNATALAGIASAIFSSVGVTQGGTYSFAKLLKVMGAWAGGRWRLKSGSTYEVLDVEDDTTVIMEVTISTSTPYRIVGVMLV